MGCHHPDRNNFGITGLLALRLSANNAGGSHVLVSHDLSSAVVVEEGATGVMIAGDYATVLHGNLAVPRDDDGRVLADRIIVNAYAGRDVLKRAGVNI